MPNRCSLREIARLAGVSHMTVSLALRNHPGIAEPTRERIQRLADSLGYRPDPLVSRVMSGLRFQREAGHVLAYVAQYRVADWTKHHVHGATLQGATEAAETFGYRLDVFEVGKQGLNSKRMHEVLHTRNIPGIILSSHPDRIGHISFDLRPFSIIQLGTGIVRPVVHRVTTNGIHNLDTAIRILRRTGAERIGLVLLEIIDARNEHVWSSTFSSYQRTIPARQRVPPLIPKNLDFASFKKWFQQYRPDSIICIESRLLDWLDQLGVRYPDDVQVAALDRKPGDLAWAGIDQNHQAVGRIALELLLGQMHVHDTGVPSIPRTTLIDGQWIDGPSCRPRSSSA